MKFLFSKGTALRFWFLLLPSACLLATSGLPVAPASASEPLGITKFTMEPIERTEVHITPGSNSFEIVNVPYSRPFTQAGAHPWALTTTGEFTTEEVEAVGTHELALVPTRDPKDIVAQLPTGLIGNPNAVPRCSVAQVTGSGEPCPASTQVGMYFLHWEGGKAIGGPIVNVTPEAGQSAEFALENTAHTSFILTAHLVHTARGYGFTVVSNEVPVVALSSFELTFWGVPADPSHDALRGLTCASTGVGELPACTGGNQRAGVGAVPFLSWPSDCSAGPQVARLFVDSWAEPGRVLEGRYEGYAEKSTGLPGVTGCDLLGFGAGISVEPNSLLADEPVGLGVTVSVPQSSSPASAATPNLRDAVVTLPQGLSISPGIVDGIRACEESGPEGMNFEGPLSEERAANGELQLAPGRCPDASTVGSATAVTPLLPEPVEGHVYLARPLCGGSRPGEGACTNQDALDGHLYQLYLELGGRGRLGHAGVDIKAHGFVEANPATGQLTTKFLSNPQTPFSELHIDLNGGPRAPLDNPAACGTATTTADFTPWSAPGVTPEGFSVPGTPDAVSSSFFNVDLAGDALGTPCPSLPFRPGFAAGTVSPQAGAFSAFTVNLTRADREQFVKGVQVHTPPGLLGMLSSVALCEEPQANLGTCPAASRIGSTTVASGAGSHPFEISGTVFLTKSYGGAPFGLSIVTNAVAGPFNLGLVVVRARIGVDPVDSTLTITTDETGPHAIPQIIFGVPLRLKQVTVNIDRPNFMFNPTNCVAQQITAAVSGSQQAVAGVSSAFAAGGCRGLAFKPGFSVTTSGRTSKQNGASLDAKVTYPPFKPASEANISYVKVELPKQLPSRLSTLQKACLAAVFNANPAACPPGSVIGVVRASTPLLPVELSGPVYFVSHGGEAFPSLIAVLQGDGVRVDLTGTTFIDKHGVTSSTFKTVPDVPVSSFELYLPEGRYSALAANGDLCAIRQTVLVKRKLTRRVHGRTIHRTVTTRKSVAGSLSMPTEMVAQNGAVLKQNTKVQVTGCPPAKAKSAGTRGRSSSRGGKHR
jgi:hypothetical protein